MVATVDFPAPALPEIVIFMIMGSEGFYLNILIDNFINDTWFFEFTVGRIKTQLIKRVSRDFFEMYKDKVQKTFEENKVIVQKLADIPSKKLRNIVAGYVTRLAKQQD